MIDWVNAVLPYPHTPDERLHGGAVMLIDEHGEVTRTTFKKALERGSFDNSVAIQSSSDEGHFRDGKHTHIWISGSPKPLQGHNLFGTDNPLELAAMLARLALTNRGRNVDEFTFRRWLRGEDVKLTRIDLTYMLDVGGETNVAAWLDHCMKQVRVKYNRRNEQKHGTVYFGKGSRRWSLKLYGKHEEINSFNKKHRLPEGIEQRDALLQYALGTIRAELTLQSMQLKDMRLQNGRIWNESTNLSFDTWRSFMDKLELSGNVRLHKSIVDTMPRAVRNAYLLWNSGYDCRRELSKATFYRQRKALLKYGIDISRSKVGTETKVVSLIRVIEATPKATPSWAFNTPLLARAA